MLLLASKNQKNLYSYTIPAGQLTGLSSDQKNELEMITENQNIYGRENGKVDGVDPDQKNGTDMVHIIDHLIQNLEYQLEQDLRLEDSSYRGKKKSEKWQRR